MAESTPVAEEKRESLRLAKNYTYDKWRDALGVPVHKGYYIQDLRTVELGYWKERDCRAAFIQLSGMEGISEVRVTEIAPGETLRPWKLAVDEIVYVLSGRGLATVWRGEGDDRKSFEWQPHSLFVLPRNFTHQISNTQGDRPVRLMHYNYLPIAMSAMPSPQFFFNNPYDPTQDGAETSSLYAEAKVVQRGDDPGWNPYYWYGNFFPDMQAWDKLAALTARGAGGRSVQIQFPDSEMSCHMSVFDPFLYKKAHRHGPGRAIVIPGGEGYSVLWEEGRDKIVVPWQEGSLFTPPENWFHQHFNLGSAPARYLALHPLKQFHGYSERIEDRDRQQIEYPNEDPSVRERFAAELGKRGLNSLMPDEAYRDPNYQWGK
ncbi:MAG: cupin domain-containing protein [Dehalococcoidia bacterium]|nr:cupin domain-containing protein [Dehalococcoidia bacterium]